MSKEDVISKFQKKEIKQEFERSGIENLWLFGSVAKWNANENSDIDLLYKYNPKLDKSFGGVFSVWWNIRQFFTQKIDLLSLDDIPSEMKKDILDSYIKIR